MNRKILIIDDSPTLRKLLRHYLQKKGYSTSEAHHGRVGLDLISKEDFDLIILDMEMPVMGGAKVLETLNEKKDFNVPILILSSDKQEESKVTGISLGAKYYMTKPFKPNEVVDRIEEIFSVRDQRK